LEKNRGIFVLGKKRKEFLFIGVRGREFLFKGEFRLIFRKRKKEGDREERILEF